VKLGSIGYINVLPVTLGLETGQVALDGELVRGDPNELNRLTRLGLLDATAVSSIEYLSCCKDYRLVRGVALSSPAAVQSVKLFSLYPPQELAGHKVAVTRASATSRALLQVLLPHIEVVDLPTTSLGELSLDQPAVLLIGDQALTGAPVAPYEMDLGLAWKERTGLPMVFAVWLARRGMGDEPERLLQESKEWGLAHHHLVLEESVRRTGLARQPLQDYFAGLRYELGPQELKSLELFYRLAVQRGLVDGAPRIEDLMQEEKAWSA